jgi:hypothetical protein
MGFNYFPDLNRYFQTLYYRNQEWFRHRHHLTASEQHRLFQAFLRMEESLAEVRGVFLQKEKAPRLGDA